MSDLAKALQAAIAMEQKGYDLYIAAADKTSNKLGKETLKAIAEKTGGFYGRADDAKTLVEIVEKINDLEKTKVKSIQYAQYSERFGPWTLGALLVLILEIVGRCTTFRKIP